MVQKIPGHISKYMQDRRMVLDQEGFENWRVQFLTLLFVSLFHSSLFALARRIGQNKLRTEDEYLILSNELIS